MTGLGLDLGSKSGISPISHLPASEIQFFSSPRCRAHDGHPVGHPLTPIAPANCQVRARLGLDTGRGCGGGCADLGHLQHSHVNFPGYRYLMSAEAMPTCFVFAFSPLAAEAILIATTMGADRTSEFAKRRPSTAWVRPVGRVSTRAVSRRFSLSGLGAQTWRLSGSGYRNLDSELLDGERVAQKGVPSVFPRRSHHLSASSTPLVPLTGSKTKLSSTSL